MSDKFSRIISFIQKGVLKVADETFEDTIIDFIGYLYLFAGFIKSKKEDENKNN